MTVRAGPYETGLEMHQCFDPLFCLSSTFELDEQLELVFKDS